VRIRDRSLIIMFTQGLSQLTTIVLYVVLTYMISKQAVGTYRQVMLVYLFLATALSLQLHVSFYYFVPKLGIEQRRTLLLQTSLMTAFVACVVAVVMFTCAGYIALLFDNPKLVPLLRIFALYPFVERLGFLIPAFMISIDRAVRAGIYTLALALGRIVAAVVVIGAGYGLSTVMWATILAGALVVVVGLADSLRFCPAGEWRFDRRLIVEQLQYAWPLLASAVVGVLNKQLDKILISVFFNPDVYAVYSSGAFQLPVIAIVTTSISTAMMPNLVKMVEENRTKEALDTWHEGARKCSFVIFPCFAFLLVTGYDLMVLLYPPGYEMASWPFRIYLLSLPVRVAIYATMFRAVGRTRPIAIGAAIGLLVNAVVSITLVMVGRRTIFGFIGPAIGTIVATWCVWAYLLREITHITSVPFAKIMRWKELGTILLISVVCGLLVFVLPLPSMPLAVKFLLQSIIYLAAFSGILFWTGILKEDEKKLLVLPFSMLRRLYSKIK